MAQDILQKVCSEVTKIVDWWWIRESNLKMNSFVDWLQGPIQIRWQILMQLFIARLHYPFLTHYRKLEEDAKNWQVDEGSSDPVTCNGSGLPLQVAKYRSWIGFPKIPKILWIYQVSSSCWLLYVIAKNLLQGLLEAFLSIFNLTKPSNCYLLGSYILSKNLGWLMATELAINHLIWRAVQRIFRRSYMISLIAFMIQSEYDVSKLNEMMEQQGVGFDSNKDSSLCLPITRHYIRCGQFKTNDGSCLTERFLKDVMCYKIYGQLGQTKFRLRPNRTLESRRLISRHIAKTSAAIITFLSSLFLIISPLILLCILRDFDYVERYPNCSLHLQQLYDERRLDPNSVTLSGHHLIAIFFDIVENSIIWIDSAIAVTVTGYLTYLINYDLVLYWHHLHLKILKLHRRIRDSYIACHAEEFKLVPSGQRAIEIGGEFMAGFCTAPKFKPFLVIPTQFKLNRGPLTNPNKYSESQIMIEVIELKYEIYDFFSQIRQADCLVSDVITASIVIWITSFAALRFSSLIRQDEVPWAVGAVQLAGLSIMTLWTVYLMSIHRCCALTQRVICSIIAYDQMQYKKQLQKALEMFNDHRHTYFTLFHHYPYSFTSYLSIIGWSFSCYFICDTLLRQHDPS